MQTWNKAVVTIAGVATLLGTGGAAAMAATGAPAATAPATSHVSVTSRDLSGSHDRYREDGSKDTSRDRSGRDGSKDGSRDHSGDPNSPDQNSGDN